MAKTTKLTDTRIKAAKPADKPIKLTDGSGLYLEVRPTGAKLWRWRYRLDSKENVFAMGEYGEKPNKETEEAEAIRKAAGILTLAEARMAAAEARKLVKAGIHPSHARTNDRRKAKQARDTTVEGVAREWLTRTGKRLKRETYRQRERLLEADLFPFIGKRPIASITRAELNAEILRTEERAPQMALLLRQLLQAIFDHAEEQGYVKESIALRLAKVATVKAKNAPKLNSEEIGAFLRACDTYIGTFEVRAAMGLAWLTLGRSMEVLESEWSEFDLDNATWRIPAGRMKKERDHLIPLSRQALELLRGLHAATGKGKFLFPNRVDRNRPTSHGALWKMTASIGWAGGKFSPHGIRGTGRTILAESGRWSREILERLLAHSEENETVAAYNAAEFLPQRAEALQYWADFLDKCKASEEGATVHHLPVVRRVA